MTTLLRFFIQCGMAILCLTVQAVSALTSELDYRLLSSTQSIDSIILEQAKKSSLKHSLVISFLSILNTKAPFIPVEVHSVQENYPLIGHLITHPASKHPIPKPGEIWVEEQLLKMLDLKLGDSLKLGNTKFRIAGIVLSDPMKLLNTLNGQSDTALVLIHQIDLQSTGLLKHTSQITYQLLLEGNQESFFPFEYWLRDHWALNGPQNYEIVRKPDSSIKQWTHEMQDKGLLHEIPNYFLMLIPPDYQKKVQAFLKPYQTQNPVYYPVVRARLLKINHALLPAQKMNLPWLQLLKISFFSNPVSDARNPYISIEKELAGYLGIQLGDRLTLEMNHRLIELPVGQFHTADLIQLKPNFLLLLPETFLEQFPKTYITPLSVPINESIILTKILKKFPMVNIMDRNMLANRIKLFIKTPLSLNSQ